MYWIHLQNIFFFTQKTSLYAFLLVFSLSLSKFNSVRCISILYGAFEDKFSQHSSIIGPVWSNGWVFVYELSGCGFVSRCLHLLFKQIDWLLFLLKTEKLRNIEGKIWRRSLERKMTTQQIFSCSKLTIKTYFTTCSDFSFVNFEHVIPGWLYYRQMGFITCFLPHI